MTLVDLIKGLKEEFKTNGDRELPAHVTVESVLAGMHVGTFTTAGSALPADQIGPAELPARARRRTGTDGD